ncbi:glycosyltransferase family 2 protein [Neobacillus cucumis]|uniref:glycosyltransferase family 2 protein n=1 Tax=Neobacillus cucumis TaxID=1740721 RepID=UPI00203F38A4|nr:glycosyltransferase family A protein [Neobacillus cucumis]MCM3729100.1 glycosyltransferase family 2 protein [Neobacillus cucumis]
MKQPLVTVFIPMYNGEEYIQEALDSIINQTYKNLDILVVDDGSTDNSNKIVSSYNDPRIRLLVNETNKGLPYTRNLGVKEAKGKYLAIMDADDIALPDRIEKQVKYMEENIDIDVVGTYYQEFGGRFNRIRKSSADNQEELKISLIFHNYIGNSTSLIRLNTLKENNLSYNPNFFVLQDYDLWIQISKVGKLFIMPEVLLKYRTGHTNITKLSKTEKAARRKKLMDSIHNDILDFYNFELTDQEKNTFNEVFNDDFYDEIGNDLLNDIYLVIRRITEQNKEKQIFNEVNFNNTIKREILKVLANPNIKLSNKLEFYNKICKLVNCKLNTAEFFKIIAKHSFKKVFF